jgi:hypothetical protein
MPLSTVLTLRNTMLATNNLRAKDKTFVAGEQVIVLVRDSNNKVYSRWRLGTVQRVLSPHSYLVDMGAGSVKHLHANHMRKFVAKVQSVELLSIRDEFALFSDKPSFVTHRGLYWLKWSPLPRAPSSPGGCWLYKSLVLSWSTRRGSTTRLQIAYLGSAPVRSQSDHPVGGG